MVIAAPNTAVDAGERKAKAGETPERDLFRTLSKNQVKDG
jgi:hypothetical protein